MLALGQPWPPTDRVTDATLDALNALWARLRPSEDGPFGNTGARFDHALLHVHAYSWSDEDQPWNLAWRDWRVRWYKYAGRGTTQNRPLALYEVVALWTDACTAFGAHQGSAAGSPVTPFHHTP